jgi:uncharacterized membrane protein YkoI
VAGLTIGLAMPLSATAQTVGVAAPIIPSDQVQYIAAAQGAAVISRLQLDEGQWKVEGRDTSGRYMTMKIDARTGQILNMYRDY